MSAYRRFRLRRVDTLDVGLTCGLMGVVTLGITGFIIGLAEGLEHSRWEGLFDLPFRVGYYGLATTLGGFVGAIALNIAFYYNGGIRLTLLDVTTLRTPEEQKDDEPPTIGPPPT
jgi:hypothetical protein